MLDWKMNTNTINKKLILLNRLFQTAGFFLGTRKRKPKDIKRKLNHHEWDLTASASSDRFNPSGSWSNKLPDYHRENFHIYSMIINLQINWKIIRNIEKINVHIEVFNYYFLFKYDHFHLTIPIMIIIVINMLLKIHLRKSCLKFINYSYLSFLPLVFSLYIN